MPRTLISRSRQQGATLVIALIILVLIMMIGVVAVTSSNTQFKLAGNLQFEDVAMNRAETAVSAAETWLSTGTNFADAGFTAYAGATPQLHPVGHLAGLAAPANDPLTMTWDGTSDTQAGSSDQRYMIEQMSSGNVLIGSSLAVGHQGASACNKVNTYMITARGQAVRGATKFVQSFYSVLSC
jgi:Tfp pilus assembly protein PilX